MALPPRFTNVSSSTLCGLVTGADPHKRIKGVVLYETTAASQEEWAVPIATTVAAQQQLLPVTAAIRAKHSCLASLPVGRDLTKVPDLADRDKAWECPPSLHPRPASPHTHHHPFSS